MRPEEFRSDYRTDEMDEKYKSVWVFLRERWDANWATIVPNRMANKRHGDFVGLGRTSLMPILYTMVGEGLLERSDNDWVIPRKLRDKVRIDGPTYAGQLLEIRCMLELEHAKRLAKADAEHRESWLDILDEIQSEMSEAFEMAGRPVLGLDESIAFWELDTEWHCAICIGSGSTAAADIVKRIRRLHGLTYRYTHADLIEQTLLEHRKIRKAIADYDGGADEKVQKAQLEAVEEEVSSHLKKSGHRFGAQTDVSFGDEEDADGRRE